MKSTARTFAIQAHGEQQYGNAPYVTHLDEVAQLARPFGEVAEVIAYLHDVVEDTPVTAKQLEANFGAFVATCIAILSDEPGRNRKERKAATYQKMARVTGKEQLALLVKAADRLANTRACIRSDNQKMWQLYLSEYAAFRQAVYRPDLCEAIWCELDTIAMA